jgi:hypothetical protein
MRLQTKTWVDVDGNPFQHGTPAARDHIIFLARMISQDPNSPLTDADVGFARQIISELHILVYPNGPTDQDGHLDESFALGLGYYLGGDSNLKDDYLNPATTVRIGDLVMRQEPSGPGPAPKDSRPEEPHQTIKPPIII